MDGLDGTGGIVRIVMKRRGIQTRAGRVKSRAAYEDRVTYVIPRRASRHARMLSAHHFTLLYARI